MNVNRVHIFVISAFFVLSNAAFANNTGVDWTLQANYGKNAQINPQATLSNLGGKKVTAAKMTIYNQSGVKQGNTESCTVTNVVGTSNYTTSAVFMNGLGTAGTYYVQVQVWYDNADPATTQPGDTFQSPNFNVN